MDDAALAGETNVGKLRGYVAALQREQGQQLAALLEDAHDVLVQTHAVAVDTQARSHATEICREAAAEGYDVVVAFGGDGTVNEAANGLAGSDTPLTALPGGSTNVFCRTLGVPNDVVDATEHLLGMADRFRPIRVDLASAGERRR